MKNKLTKEQKIVKKEAWQQKLLNKGNAVKQKNSLCPRCIFKEQDFVLSSEGYFAPCCWLDDELYRSQPYVNDFFQPHVNIENHDNIQDIFDSDEWKNFWDILLNHPEDAPPVCYEYCSSDKGEKEYKHKDENISIISKH